ncbi:hypothetical protein FFW72_22620 [Escherichia coli]|nr:hypothetical protein [Escherichia coli]
MIAFLHHQAKAAGLAGQQRLPGCGQRRPDTPRIFCQPLTRIRERLLRSICRKYRQRLPLTAGQNKFRPGSGQFVNGGGQERRQYAAVTVDE